MRKPCTRLITQSAIGLLLLLYPTLTWGQAPAPPFAAGLKHPIGLTLDSLGRLWVAESGTGTDDGQISIIMPDGSVHPFLGGLPSDTNAVDEIVGAWRVAFMEGQVVIVQGEGVDGDSLSGALLMVDTTGFMPGEDSLTRADIDSILHISAFVLDEGYAESNPFAFVMDAATGNLLITDAAANAVLVYDPAADTMGVFAEFPPVPNNTGVGPPMADAVPTRILAHEDQFLVGTLTGFPFSDSAASVYAVSAEGAVSMLYDSLTTVVDMAIDPMDGQLVVLQRWRFMTTPPGPLMNSGMLLKLTAEGIDTLMQDLFFPSGLAMGMDGTVYISSDVAGTVIRASVLTSNRPLPAEAVGFNIYPNPFQGSTAIRYQLDRPQPVRIEVFDPTGRRVATLRDQTQAAGTYTQQWSGHNDLGQELRAGYYLIRLQIGDHAWTKATIKQ
ncbi:Por secretion system C-terminal sorting domain-containing protein [Catalinimonas alkaloidigena]|uniref:Por secretion system C-terminal sorting domain-containing protein n=1 Tax=Catalinimonas alkaloidigena TaxID=1075417 RepID=A0A1G9LRX3_9BACT|nr:ScyD/ScyE family protein [Catalinimonas alkaloidigena]SDL64706.1 Por secretion system C-terminal sorting domain-containing protein [Catalinimonas alkaloidigena]